MEEKKINEKESIELIARMLSDTKSRLEVGDGNILLNWGVLTVAVATVVWIAVAVTNNPAYNGLWGLMVLGWLLNRKHTVAQKKRGYKSYTDQVCAKIWRAVSILGVSGALMCAIFQYATGTSPRFAMFIYALMVVGGGTFASGAVLKVRSMVFGGAFSVGFGFGLICCLLTGIAIKPVWLMPIFILCFGLMMILPGLEMRQKARKEYERA